MHYYYVSVWSYYFILYTSQTFHLGLLSAWINSVRTFYTERLHWASASDRHMFLMWESLCFNPIYGRCLPWFRILGQQFFSLSTWRTVFHRLSTDLQLPLFSWKSAVRLTIVPLKLICNFSLVIFCYCCCNTEDWTQSFHTELHPQYIFKFLLWDRVWLNCPG